MVFLSYYFTLFWPWRYFSWAADWLDYPQFRSSPSPSLQALAVSLPKEQIQNKWHCKSPTDKTFGIKNITNSYCNICIRNCYWSSFSFICILKTESSLHKCNKRQFFWIQINTMATQSFIMHWGYSLLNILRSAWFSGWRTVSSGVKSELDFCVTYTHWSSCACVCVCVWEISLRCYN